VTDLTTQDHAACRAATEALFVACEAADANGVAASLAKGAPLAARNEEGSSPAHILIDPWLNTSDEAQARCLALLLSAGLNIMSRNKSGVPVLDRISFRLPLCAQAVLREYEPGSEDRVYDLRDFLGAEALWWNTQIQAVRATYQAECLDQATPRSAQPNKASRL
jgi:hypothetical protein